MGHPGRPALLTVDDALALNVAEVVALSRRHLGADQHRMMRLLGFDTTLVRRAEDMHYIDAGGRRVVDFFGGFGTLAMGHNHPRILAVRRRFAEQRRHEIGMAFPSQYAAALATNLARIAPGDLDVVQLCCTGSEAVETALRIAAQAQGPRRPAVAYASRSFHGKTRGALSVTDSARYRSHFRLVRDAVRVPFGDIGALAGLLRKQRRIGAVILETVQGGAGVVVPPPGYLRAVRRLCDAHGVLWIADEVQCGVGRTGRFFAFEHAGVLPDLVTLAKSLGGGKAAVGAVITRRPVHRRACPDAAAALALGAGTFSGTGEACCTALEALSVLYDEDLIGNAERTGGYLMRRLEGLRLRYPELVAEVRGLGLMAGIRLAGISAGAPAPLRRAVRLLEGRLSGGLAALTGSLLLAEHGVLVGFTEYDRDVLRLEPPLTTRPEHVDQLVDALADLLGRGPRRLALDYLRVVRGWWPDAGPVRSPTAGGRLEAVEEMP
jgi:ornithine--oxo-acid transaminase